jgi:gamma-glutamylcyclotransferase (GGCT)/AIG2-like uncharacterized protein YtfP
MPSASVRLFVYGSLKRGGRHHDELAGARFLGLAETEPGYRLEALGDGEYLALVPVAGSRDAAASAISAVKGELFEVDESLFPALDAFEGDAYIRGQVRLRTDLLGKTVFALAYLKKAD